MSKDLVSIVLLNWNGIEDTLECLKSLRKQSYKNLEIIVVDNGSEDGSKKILAKEKGIIYVNLEKNYGFTGGHIRGLEVARGRYIALINNDLVLDKDWVEAAIDTFRRHPKAAVVGSKSYKWNDDNPAYDTSNTFTSWQEVNPRTGHTRTLLIGEDERQVDSISGAALMVDTNCLVETGYLDDDFFAYYEETDLIARLLRAGYEAYYNPSAKAWHKVAGSSKGGEASYFYLYMMHRNRYIFGLKNLDQQYLKPFMHNYFSEFLHALGSHIVHPSTDSRARINAYIWNRKNKRRTLRKRRSVLKLGESYNDHLGKHRPEDVTVVIPCYNYGQYVKEAIESTLSQTLLPKRILIINDGSTDNTQQVIQEYKKHPLVEVINKKNSGVIDTKNLGLSKSDTYWTIFFDADDVLYPKYIEKVVEHATETQSDVVYTDMELFGINEHAIFHANAYTPSRIIRKNFIHNSSLLNTSLVKQAGGYKPIMKDGLEDWELYLSLAELGAKFAYVPEAIFKYRQHESSMSRNSAVLKKEKELYELLLSLHPSLRKYASRPRRWTISILKGGSSFIIHPSLFIALVKALPKAFIAFAETLIHQLREHKGKMTKRL